MSPSSLWVDWIGSTGRRVTRASEGDMAGVVESAVAADRMLEMEG